MTIHLQSKQKIVEQKKSQCDKLVIEIIQKQRAADEQKNVEIQTQKTEDETKACDKIRLEAQKELDQAIPALEKAEAALDKLDKKAITNIRSYKHPPKMVETVMSAVMVILNKDTSWLNAKKQLANMNFKKFKNFDKDNLSNQTLEKLINI